MAIPRNKSVEDKVIPPVPHKEPIGGAAPKKEKKKKKKDD